MNLNIQSGFQYGFLINKKLNIFKSIENITIFVHISKLYIYNGYKKINISYYIK